MGHSEEGHKKFVQKNEGTTYLSVYTGRAVDSTVFKSVGPGTRLPGIHSQHHAY